MLKIGLISISDRAFNGIYEDQGLPILSGWLEKALLTEYQLVKSQIPDVQSIIEKTLIKMVDEAKCDLILTTGGTGPTMSDVTPDATEAVADRILPGFGEQMRRISLNFVPTAILSRQIGAIRKKTLIVNLPGRPSSITETLEGINDIEGIFSSIPYCVTLLTGKKIETDENIVSAFYPAK